MVIKTECNVSQFKVYEHTSIHFFKERDFRNLVLTLLYKFCLKFKREECAPTTAKFFLKLTPFKACGSWEEAGHNEHSTTDNGPSIVAFHLRITIHSKELFSFLGMSQVPAQTNVDAAQPNHK